MVTPVITGGKNVIIIHIQFAMTRREETAFLSEIQEKTYSRNVCVAVVILVPDAGRYLTNFVQYVQVSFSVHFLCICTPFESSAGMDANCYIENKLMSVN